jgi:serine/threonine protein kinase
MTRDAGTLLYMAPEVFSSNAGYGTSADVYSYALVVLEIFTGESPFAEVDFRFMLEFVDMILSKRVSPNVSRLPVSCPDVICEIVRQASSYEAEKRPSSKEILKRLNSAFRGMSAASLPVQKHMRGSGGSNPSSAALPSLRKVRSNEPNAAPPVSAVPVSKGKDEAE